MSLMMRRSSSSSSRLECRISSSSCAWRGRDSATWVPPIRLASGVRSSCATSALKASSCRYVSCCRASAPLKATAKSASSTGRRETCSACACARRPQRARLDRQALQRPQAHSRDPAADEQHRQRGGHRQGRHRAGEDAQRPHVRRRIAADDQPHGGTVEEGSDVARERAHRLRRTPRGAARRCRRRCGSARSAARPWPYWKRGSSLRTQKRTRPSGGVSVSIFACTRAQRSSVPARSIEYCRFCRLVFSSSVWCRVELVLEHPVQDAADRGEADERRRREHRHQARR